MSESLRLQNMKNAWQHLVEASKQRSRYFFHDMQPKTAEDRDHSPRKVLRTLRGIVGPLGLTKHLRPGDKLYRARIADGTWQISDGSQFYAPPPEKASAGRMNPAGVSYFYLAEEPETALLEVMTRPPVDIAVAEFRVRQDLCYLDLRIPPSFEDMGLTEAEDDAIALLREFLKTILQSVGKNGQEHVEYVASQIVCEFFAHAHELPWSKSEEKPWSRLYGLRYPSVVYPQGSNIVLFPSGTSNNFRELLEFVDSETRVFAIKTWDDFDLPPPCRTS